MAGLAKDPRLDFCLRRNRLDGAGLYYGRRGRIGPVQGESLAPFLDAWVRSSPYRRMGVIPIMRGGLFDDGEAHEVEAILGDRMVDLTVDEDMVIPGMLRTYVPRFIESKATAMKPDDPELFRALAEEHGVPFSGLLDGEWAALLYRTPTFGMGKTPARVALMVGLGMRPKTLKGLPLPAGMKIWRNPKWSIVCSEIAAVEKPARTLELGIDAVIDATEVAQAAVDEVAKGSAWRAMIEREEWGEHDLEVQLYVRLD